jgi:hypothetical protein
MMWNTRTLLILVLVAVASASTATLAQKNDAEKPAVVRDFVKVGNTYYRISRIDAVAVVDGRVHLSFAGTMNHFDAKECVDPLRVLGLPPIE